MATLLKAGEVKVKRQEEAPSKYAYLIESAGHSFKTDEPLKKGGTDTGPSPFELLAASLASCTALTLEYYADHKGIELPKFEVLVSGEHKEAGENKNYHLSRTLVFPDDTSDELREKLLEIAGKCPVHKALTGEITISSTAQTKGE